MHKITKKHFLIILYSLFFVVVSLNIFSHSMGDSDFFWHYKLGEYIVSNKKIMTTDVFSWLGMERQLQTFNHSWLSGVLIYLCGKIYPANACFAKYVWLGLTGFVFYTILQLTFLEKLIKKAGISYQSVLYHALQLFSILVFCTYMLFILARPACIGYSLFLAAVYFMMRVVEEGKKYYAVFPLISLLWANLHGGSLPMYFALIGMFAVLFCIPGFSFGRLRHEQNLQTAKTFFIHLLSSAAAGMINPYTYHLLTYFFLENDAAAKSMVTEWRPAKTSDIGILICFFLLLFALFFIQNRIPIYIILPFFMMFFMCAKYCRMESYAVILAIPLLFYTLETNKLPAGLISSCRFIPIYLLVIGSVTIIGGIGVVRIGIKSRTDCVPPSLVQFIKESGYQRVYSDYTVGGKFIFEDIPSFIDSRADLFEGQEIVDTINFGNGDFYDLNGAADYVDKYGFDAIVLPSDSFDVGAMLLYQGWENVYHDGMYVVLERPQEK